MDIASLWQEYDEVDVADVSVDIEAPDLLPTYSYSVPEALRETATVGACVHVPFGGQEKLGYIMARHRVRRDNPLCKRLRDILSVVAGAINFTDEQADVARWIADRYVCDLKDTVRCIAPAAFGARVVTRARLADDRISSADAAGSIVQAHIIETLRSLGGEAELEILRKTANVSAFTGSYAALKTKGLVLETREIPRPKVAARTVMAYVLNAMAQEDGGKLSSAGRRIMDALIVFDKAGQTPVPTERLLAKAQASVGALKTLVDNGFVAKTTLSVRRSPNTVPELRTIAPPLTVGQRGASLYLGRVIEQQAMPDLPASARGGAPSVALLYGVTASGKTEVYLNAIEKTLAAGRNAIVLVPEIALTTQVVEVFTGRFGDEVAVLHSRLSEGERYDEWRRLQERHARIAVGARSAVFAPIDNVGLIVVDEEHEASYKQESLPRYHARDVAIERARAGGASVLLGSATPSLETYYQTEQGTIAKLSMPERIGNRPMPSVDVVDMRDEWKEHKALFSHRLIEEMGERLARNQQTILFLNRRGYAQFVLCRDCGFVARCPNCAVSLAYHAAWATLKCHHCDYTRKAPSICPDCGGERVKQFGIGTERVEEEVLKHFPSARVARMDRDTTSRKGAHADILGRFRRGAADILIGTQMVAKGLDFPNVTLVGVISADTSINMPDFRAAERTFQLLTQVAGRAGRGEHPGNVVIQTFSPDHYSVMHATNQDYESFYQKEIKFREELGYPPFRRFANLVIHDEDAIAAEDRAARIAVALKEGLPREVELIGPAPAPIARLKGQWRFHIVLRGPVDAPLSDLIRMGLSRLEPAERARLIIDVDPMTMA